MDTKEAQLLTAVLTYIARCIAENDRSALQKLGLGLQEVDAFSQLGPVDLQRLVASAARLPLLEIRCDPEQLRRRIHWVLTEQAQDQTQQALIQADAPSSLLMTCYGMGKTEYARHRQWLGLQSRGGRPRLPDPETVARIRQTWDELVQGILPEAIIPEYYLRLHQRTGVPLRILWPLIQEWQSSQTSQPARQPAGVSRPRSGSPAHRTATPAKGE